MNQEFPSQYYMVVDEKSTGPFTLDEITLHPALTPDTLVWKPGIDNWVAARTLPELAPAFIKHGPENNYQGPPEYNRGNHRPNEEYEGYGYEHKEEPQNRFADNPQYQNHHSYNQPPHNNYYGGYDRRREYNPYDRNGYNRPQMRTNWLPWAIVATVLGLFTYCLGAIFGIIGIVQANKANTLYAQGYDHEAETANNNAKIMTIIGLVIAGLGIIIAIIFGSLLSSMSFY